MLLLLVALAFAQSGHDGQPDHCDNYFANPHKCECSQATVCPEPGKPQAEDPKCQVYCRKDHCHCISPCAT
jgi:hypothetical protein